METSITQTPFIPQPSAVTPIDVDIVVGAEYDDALWREALDTINAAEDEVAKARAIKREADAAYELAMSQRARVQIPRDQMIATDRRSPAQLGRLAGIGRARCSQIRKTATARNAASGTSS